MNTNKNVYNKNKIQLNFTSTKHLFIWKLQQKGMKKKITCLFSFSDIDECPGR